MSGFFNNVSKGSVTPRPATVYAQSPMDALITGSGYYLVDTAIGSGNIIPANTMQPNIGSLVLSCAARFTSFGVTVPYTGGAGSYTLYFAIFPVGLPPISSSDGELIQICYLPLDAAVTDYQILSTFALYYDGSNTFINGNGVLTRQTAPNTNTQINRQAQWNVTYASLGLTQPDWTIDNGYQVIMAEITAGNFTAPSNISSSSVETGVRNIQLIGF